VFAAKLGVSGISGYRFNFESEETNECAVTCTNAFSLGETRTSGQEVDKLSERAMMLPQGE
jgi:hypothetical protein